MAAGPSRALAERQSRCVGARPALKWTILYSNGCGVL